MSDPLEEVVEGPRVPLPKPTLDDADRFMGTTARQLHACLDFLEATLADVQEGQHDCDRSVAALHRVGLGLYGVATFYTGIVAHLFRENIEGCPPEVVQETAEKLVAASRLAAAQQLDQLEVSVRKQIKDRIREEGGHA